MSKKETMAAKLRITLGILASALVFAAGVAQAGQTVLRPNEVKQTHCRHGLAGDLTANSPFATTGGRSLPYVGPSDGLFWYERSRDNGDGTVTPIEGTVNPHHRHQVAQNVGQVRLVYSWRCSHP